MDSLYLLCNQTTKKIMAKKSKLREWEIPMNLSNEERELYKMTAVDQIDACAKSKMIGKKVDFN
jgi:hypothetical protein